MLVSFYNNVRGLVPRGLLGVEALRAKDADLEESFRVGQTVQAKVMNCENEDRKLILSLDLAAENKAGGGGGADVSNLVGTTVTGVVTEKRDTALTLTVSADGTEELSGGVTLEHLSDHPGLCDGLLESFAVGDVMDNLLVLNGSTSKRRLFLTRKPSLLAAAAAEALPSSIADLTAGAIMAGYVHNVTNFGVFVRFAGSLTGLAMRSNVADEFVTDPDEHFARGQSVRALISKVDAGAEKFELVLKQSVCSSDTDAFLCSHVQDTLMLSGGADDEWWAKMRVGATIEGKVEDKRYGGIIIDLGNDITGFVKAEHCLKVACEVGDTVTGRILDIDPKKRIVDLTVLPDLLKSLPKKKDKKDKKRKSSANKVRETAHGTVQLVKTDYAVVSLDGSGHFCVVACKDYNLSTASSTTPCEYKARVVVTISRLENDHADASPHRGALYGIVQQGTGAAAASSSGSKKSKKPKVFDLENDIKSFKDVKVGMRTTGQGEPWPAAAIPVENPCCSCELTRAEGRSPQDPQDPHDRHPRAQGPGPRAHHPGHRRLRDGAECLLML